MIACIWMRLVLAKWRTTQLTGHEVIAFLVAASLDEEDAPVGLSETARHDDAGQAAACDDIVEALRCDRSAVGGRIALVRYSKRKSC